ncbi:MAG: tRNA pseudouridine(55) synthase TruB [Chloroflexota bacterium]|jgi:tRNA pseudouridine55 synthase|nr:tRNA pseudouridine(55) synthase TruB [Chloroflexota bacterium]
MKPRRLTSSGVVSAIKRAGRFGRVGHAGTLDPLADGVLPIAVGGATRMIDFLHRQPKRYLAWVMFGVETDTHDLEGEMVARSPRVPGTSTLRAAVAAMVGKQSQWPPAYSAIKIGGQRAYDLARRGDAPKLAPRTIEIHSLDIIDIAWWSGEDLVAVGLARMTGESGNRGRLVAALDIGCGAGTYIRSLARDLGRGLGTVACLAGLRRTGVGPFAVGRAVPLDEAVDAIAGGYLEAIAYPADQAVLPYPGAVLGPAAHRRFVNGNHVAWDAASGDLRVYGNDGAFLGMGEAVAGTGLRPRIVMPGQAGGAP